MPILVLAGLMMFIVLIPLLIMLLVELGMFLIRKKPFPSKLLYTTLIGMMAVLCLYVYQTSFFTFDRIDRESMQKGPGPITSPTGRYTADAFYEPYGGAAGGVNVWIEVADHNHADKAKTIYYSNVTTKIEIDWRDDDVLSIQNFRKNENKTIELNVKKEIYHDTGLACRSLVLKDEYETCYSGR